MGSCPGSTVVARRGVRIRTRVVTGPSGVAVSGRRAMARNGFRSGCRRVEKLQDRVGHICGSPLPEATGWATRAPLSAAPTPVRGGVGSPRQHTDSRRSLPTTAVSRLASVVFWIWNPGRVAQSQRSRPHAHAQHHAVHHHRRPGGCGARDAQRSRRDSAHTDRKRFSRNDIRSEFHRFDTTGQPAYEQQHVGGIDDRCAQSHRHADRVTSKVVGVRHTRLIPAMRPMLTARSVRDDHLRCHTACAARMIAG